jgi:hypothetical protein
MKAIALAALLLALLSPGAAAADEEPVPKLKGTLTYARSGGIAGISHKLTVRRDGRARLDTRDFRLRKVEREAVAKLVEAADLRDVEVEPKPAVPDSFVHTLTYRGRTLTFDDASTPKKVKKLRDLLGRLISKYDDTRWMTEVVEWETPPSLSDQTRGIALRRGRVCACRRASPAAWSKSRARSTTSGVAAGAGCCTHTAPAACTDSERESPPNCSPSRPVSG